MNTEKMIEFNNVVENVKNIIREGRHNPNVSSSCISEMNRISIYLDNVNFKMSFVNNPEDYVHEKMLDAMDYLLDKVMEKEKSPESLTLVNSVYDVIREWYFENF